MEQYEHRGAARTDTNSPREGSTFDSANFFRNHLVKQDNGSLEITGDDLSAVELALLDTEKRRRGSQASSSREKARADRTEVELIKVKEGVQTMTQPTPIDPALKYSDPDEYIKQTLVAQRSDPYQETFDTARQQASQEVGQKTAETMLAEHNADNPDRVLNMNMLEMDLPPRLVNQFQSGDLSPQDFLSQAADVLYRPTETHNPSIPVTPDLGAVAGGSTPTDEGGNDAMVENYSKAIF